MKAFSDKREKFLVETYFVERERKAESQWETEERGGKGMTLGERRRGEVLRVLRLRPSGAIIANI